MLPVEKGRDKDILRSEATRNQGSERGDMMESLRWWWVGRRERHYFKSSHHIKKRKKVLLFSLMECSISLESAITSWGHCRSSIPRTDHLETKFVMWWLHSIVITTCWTYQFEYKLQFYKTANHMGFLQGTILFESLNVSCPWISPGWFKLSRKTFFFFFFFFIISGCNRLLENLPALIWS